MDEIPYASLMMQFASLTSKKEKKRDKEKENLDNINFFKTLG